MKTLIAAAFAASLSLAGATASQAMPVAPATPAGGGVLTLIAGGCGPGFERTRRGYCVRSHVRPAPRRWHRPAARYCPRGWHMNRAGRCVRNWR